MELTRRQMVTGTSLAASTMFVGLYGQAEYAKAATAPEAWDLEADVVVVGFGGAGASAAVAASDAGASVILLEKAPEADAGGNFSVSGGGGILANPDDTQMAFDFIRMQLPSNADDDEVWGFIEESLSTPKWFEDHGYDGIVSFNETGGGSMYAASPYAHGWNGTFSGVGGGAGNFAWLKGIIDADENIDVRYETPACKLIFEPETKEVFGVVALDPEGNKLNVLARRGVVMACGGFENNKGMLTTYYPPEVPIFPCGTPYNTGDGVDMVNELGVKLRGFSSAEWGCHCCKAASEEIGVQLGFDFLGTQVWANSIMVNDQGKRFVNETLPVVSAMPVVVRPLHDKRQLPELAFDMDLLRYTNLPMFLVCDDTRVKAGALFNGAGANSVHMWSHVKDWYTWTEDNEAEVERGWIKKADTLEELAEMLGVDAAGLAATVEAYNAACEAGEGDELGRTGELTPVMQPPFYGCELGLGLINTQGGPVRNAKYQVIGYDNQPVKRLYAGGEFGSLYPWLYQGAGNVAECINSRAAGANAAAEEPWC